MDEIGVPFDVTIDYDTIKNDTVTLRERDSMTQVLVPSAQLPDVIIALTLEDITWASVQAKYPAVEVKEE
jgi:glycyl-tRNA synthetase